MAYCTSDDIIHILSEQGIDGAIDDNRTGDSDGPESEFVAGAIERAEARINQYLMQWYNLSTLPGNKWIKWCSATFAAIYLMRRRGEGAPDGLVVLAQEYEAHLMLVMQNMALIPVGAADAGTAQLLTQNSGLTMSNLTVDQRFRTRKIRYSSVNSVGPTNSKLPRSPDYRQSFIWE